MGKDAIFICSKVYLGKYFLEETYNLLQYSEAVQLLSCVFWLSGEQKEQRMREEQGQLVFCHIIFNNGVEIHD